MYIEMNPTGLTLTDLICVAHRKRSEDTGFPYAVQSCRCSNCRYVSAGKCSLKECCCMAERVRAHTCTFAEILNTCFANVKDNVFHYRLRLAAERATMTKTCFLDREHRARFLKALHRVRGNDKNLIAQLFVLTATESLWSASDDAIGKSSISYLDIDFREFSENDYLFYCIAYDLGNGTSHTDIEDLSNDEVVDFDLFRVVCSAIAISVYGYGIRHNSLFPCGGKLIAERTNDATENFGFVYGRNELWLLRDMTFAVTRSITYGNCEGERMTYRYFIGNDLDCFRKYCEADDILARVRELIRENESQFEV